VNALSRAFPAGAAAFAIAASAFRAHVAPQEAGAWHGLTGSISPAIAGSAILAFVLVWRAGALLDPRPLGMLWAAGLKFVPAFTGALPILLVFEAETMTVIACVAIAIIAARTAAEGPPGRAIERLHPAAVAAVAFLVFALAGLRIPGPAGPQGDEPHYLLIAESLLSDGDADLKDEFDERAYARFTAAALEPHRAPRTPPGTSYSIHTAGLPALVAPGYAAAGYAGARAVVSLIVAIAVALTFRAARRVHGPGPALAIAAALTFATPLPVYANALYPDSVAVLAAAAGVDAATGGGAAIRRLFLASLVLLPWLHPRFLPLGVALAALVAWVSPTRLREAVAGALALGIGAGLLIAHFGSVFGSYSLSAAYGPGFDSDVTVQAIPRGLAGLLFDRQFGWLLFAPVLLLSLPGAAFAARRDPARGLLFAAVAASVILVGASFSMWWGGASPPARFTIAATPVVALLAWSCRGSRAAVLLAPLAGFGAGVLSLALEAPRTLHNRPDGESGLLRRIAPALNLDPWLPSLLPPARRTSPAELVDPLGAGARLLAAWDDSRRTFGGDDRRDAFVLPVPLGGAASEWSLSAGTEAASPRFALPPGAWTIDFETEAAAEEGVLNVGDLRITNDDGASLARGVVRVGERTVRVTLEVGDRDRRLRIVARGLQSRFVVLRAWARPAPAPGA
jgi:hypothetical protein